MASIRREVALKVSAGQAWDAVRDMGNLHTRLVKGFVTDTKLEDGARLVTFANGMTARELIVDLDDEQKRIVWSATGGRLTHHNASFQLVETGPTSCRGIWIADLLPHDMAPGMAAMIDQGLVAMKKTLEQ